MSKRQNTRLSILDDIHEFKRQIKRSIKKKIEKKLHSNSSQFFKSKDKRKARTRMNSLSEKKRLYSILRLVPVCNMLSNKQIEDLASSVVPRTYFKNDVIIKTNSTGHSMYIIEKGHACVIVDVHYS